MSASTRAPAQEVVAAHLALGLVSRRVLHLGARVPGHRVADAPETVGAGRLQRLQHRAHVLAQVKVGVADDGCRRLAGAIQPVVAGGRQALHELNLAHRAHFLRAAGPVHRAGLDEHGRADVVAAVDVVGQFVEQVALVRNPLGAVVPEVMMGVADGYFRLQGLLRGQGEPVVASERHKRASVQYSSRIVCRPIIAQQKNSLSLEGEGWGEGEIPTPMNDGESWSG